MADGARDPRSDSALQLDGRTRERLLAVVLDANAYGRAKPDLWDLERLALRLNGIGIETWVPEPVAWEWAQHLAEDWHAVTTAASTERKNLARGRIPMPEPLYKGAGEVIEVFMRAIRGVEHVRVITATPQNALEGLKDQVMQRAPGKRKNSVKTGASDSAWLRDVLAVADDAIARLLFLTEDKDLPEACEAWGLAAPLTRSRQQLRPTLFNVTIDDGHATRAVMRYLLDRLPIQLNADLGEGSVGFDIGNTPSLDQAIETADEGDDDVRVYGANVTRLTSLVGLGGVTVASDSDAPGGDPSLQPRWSADLGSACHHHVLATVYFLGDAEATVNRLHLGGDPETTSLTYEDVFIRANLAFHFTDGVITGVSPEDDAWVSLPDPRWADSYDAFDNIREALSCVPSLVIPDSFESDTRNGEHRLEIEGHDVELIFTWSPSDNWHFTLELTDDSNHDFVEVSCEYDASSWVGGRDGFHMSDPYYPVVEQGELSPWNPIWSVPAWIIKHLDWSRVPDQVDGV